MNTGVEDREEWRARIMRALQELRSEDSISDGRARRDDRGEEGCPESVKY